MSYHCIRFVLLLMVSISTSTLAKESFYLPPMSPETSGNLITIKGSNTLGAKLVPTWAKQFLASKGVTEVRIQNTTVENEYRITGLNGELPVNIQVHAHGSGTGFTGLYNGNTHIAMSSRPVKANENEKVDPNIDLRSFDTEHVVALDGLAIIVHPKNPVQRLTKTQVADIFSGKIASWADVGGHPMPINIYARDNKSGTWDTFKNLVLQKEYSLSHNAPGMKSLVVVVVV